MTRADAASLLDLLEERAPKLRAAGCTRVVLVGLLEADLEPAEMTPDEREVEPQRTPGVFDDPATFGYQDSEAKPPGRKRER